MNSPSVQSTKVEKFEEYGRPYKEEEWEFLASCNYEDRKRFAFQLLSLAFKIFPATWSQRYPKQKVPPSLLSFFKEFNELWWSNWEYSQEKMIKTFGSLVKRRVQNTNTRRCRKELLRVLLGQIHEPFRYLFVSNNNPVEYNTYKMIIKLLLSLIPNNKHAEKKMLRDQLATAEQVYSQKEHPEKKSEKSK